MPSPLKSSRLRRILAAYTVNRLGTWIGTVALMLAVFDHTHSALGGRSAALAWQALPAFVVPAVVARVEASARRSELSGLYIFEAVTTAALAVLLWHFWLPAVLLLAALDGTAALAASALLRTEVARAARDQVEAELAQPDQARSGADAPVERAVEDAAQEAERKANAALNVAFSATFVLGPRSAAPWSPPRGHPRRCSSMSARSSSVARCCIDLHPHVEEAGDGSVRARLRAAWRHINEAPSLRALLLAEAVALVFFESAAPIEVTYAKATLHAGDRGFGLLLGAWGAGAVLGSLVFARSLRRPLGTLLSVGTLAVGLAYVGFAAAPSLGFACIVALFGGVGNGVELPSLISIVQRLTPPHLHGRMMGAVESLAALCVAIGLPLGGVLVALSSPRVAFLVIGLGAVATTVALLRLSPAEAEQAADGETPSSHDPTMASDVLTSESSATQTHVP